MDCPGCGHPIELHGIQRGCRYQSHHRNATRDCTCLYTQDAATIVFYRIENERLKKVLQNYVKVCEQPETRRDMTLFQMCKFLDNMREVFLTALADGDS